MVNNSINIKKNKNEQPPLNKNRPRYDLGKPVTAAKIINLYFGFLMMTPFLAN